MFTGIIETLVKISLINPKGVEICDPFVDGELKLGDSVALNGVCLTLSRKTGKKLFFDISSETFERTSFKILKAGDELNAERALKAGDRFGGHFVAGHVDTAGSFLGKEKNSDSYVFKFKVPDTSFLVEKGSVAVNGVSLTCYGIGGYSFKTSVIPHTFENTNLKFLKKGGYVNLEFDILAKYAIKKTSKIDAAFLKENGYE